jgi:hypothetical protein
MSLEMSRVQLLLRQKTVQDISAALKPHIVQPPIETTLYVKTDRWQRKHSSISTKEDLLEPEHLRSSKLKVQSTKLSPFKRLKKFIQIENQSNIESNQKLGCFYLGKLLKKALTKVIQNHRRRDLEEHKGKSKRPTFTDGLFEIFFPDLFVLEYKREQARSILSKNPRVIPINVIKLAKEIMKFTTSSIQACSKVSPTPCQNSYRMKPSAMLTK